MRVRDCRLASRDSTCSGQGRSLSKSSTDQWVQTGGTGRQVVDQNPQARRDNVPRQRQSPESSPQGPHRQARRLQVVVAQHKVLQARQPAQRSGQLRRAAGQGIADGKARVRFMGTLWRHASSTCPAGKQQPSPSSHPPTSVRWQPSSRSFSRCGGSSGAPSAAAAAPLWPCRPGLPCELAKASGFLVDRKRRSCR